ncbi:hypothetical protein BGZ68_000360 [Mortierella alpina]|nr:hypothetical protein BGZ68_000360 [Mortierella alpina]
MQKGFLNKAPSGSTKKDNTAKPKQAEQTKPKAEEQAKPKAEEPQSREHYQALADKYMEDWAKEMGGSMSYDPETETTRIHSGMRFSK